MGVCEGTAELHTGAKIPLIGLGTVSFNQNEEEIKAAVAIALQVGYRHFDTASSYNSERPLGQALNQAFQNGLVKREQVFVTTKLWSSQDDDPVSALKTSLENLHLEYVDLYLIHWPVKLRQETPSLRFKEEDILPVDIKSTWQGMEQCAELGLTKAIGLSNFSSKKIEDVLSYAKILPAVDQVGYRQFDTASMYGSESALGEALNEAFQNGVVKREEVFVSTKLWNTDHDDPVSALRTSLKNLQLEYVDLYLIHWPVKLKKEAPLDDPMHPREEDILPVDIKSTWQGMEQCVELGLTKAVGVSNFSSKKIEDMLSYAKIPPAVDQVEMHVMWQQKKLREFCSKHNIHVSAWSPLGGPNTKWGSNIVIDNSLIQEIAQKHGKTQAQVMLRWGLEQGVSVLPKSYNKGRISENFQIFDWSLDSEDYEKMSKVEQWKIGRGEAFCSEITSPYKTLEELWDGEI